MTSTASQYLVHCGASIRAEMETVRHLDCLRCALAATFGIRTSTIADDDFDAGVRAQPIGEHLSGAIVEQVDWLVCF
jgi:hypothetical protein